MFGLFKIQFPLYDVDDTGEGNPNSNDSTLDILNSDVDNEEESTPEPETIDLAPEEEEEPAPKPVKKEKEVESEEEEDDDLTQLEQELAEEDAEIEDEQLELVTPVRRKEILAKYPNVFKDFPYLEKAYYREQKFTDIFPTIQDAEEAAEHSKQLKGYEQLLRTGDITEVLKAVKEAGDEAFNKMVDNYLIFLAKVDQPRYQHVINNTYRHGIMIMMNDKDEIVRNAAKVLNQYLFDTDQVVPPQILNGREKKEEDPRIKEMQDKELKRVREAFNRARGDVNEKVRTRIIATISKYIDPNQRMTAFVKEAAVNKVDEKVRALLGKDTRFKVVLDKLWEKSYKDDFSADTVKRIESAILSRAQTLLPTVIKAARKEALNGSRSIPPREKDRKGPLAAGKARTSTSSSNSGRQGEGMKKGESTLDYFNRD